MEFCTEFDKDSADLHESGNVCLVLAFFLNYLSIIYVYVCIHIYIHTYTYKL